MLLPRCFSVRPSRPGAGFPRPASQHQPGHLHPQTWPLPLPLSSPSSLPLPPLSITITADEAPPSINSAQLALTLVWPPSRPSCTDTLNPAASFICLCPRPRSLLCAEPGLAVSRQSPITTLTTLARPLHPPRLVFQPFDCC